MSYLVANLEDRFSHDEAHIVLGDCVPFPFDVFKLHCDGFVDDSPRIHKSWWILVNPSTVEEELLAQPGISRDRYSEFAL